MRRRLLLIMAIFSALALGMTGLISAAEHNGEPNGEPNGEGEGEYAVTVLEEQNGSGYHGMAVLRGEREADALPGNDEPIAPEPNGDPFAPGPEAGEPGNPEHENGINDLNGNGERQTEIVVVLTSTNGNFLGLFGGNNGGEDIGQAAILSGTCEEPMEIVEEIGELTALGLVNDVNGVNGQPEGVNGEMENDLPDLWAVAGTVNMSLDELLTGDYVIGVLERDDEVDDNDIFAPGEPAEPTEPTEPGNGAGTGQPEIGNGQPENGVNGVEEETITTLACGVLTADARIDAVTDEEPDEIEIEPMPEPEPGPEPEPMF